MEEHGVGWVAMAIAVVLLQAAGSGSNGAHVKRLEPMAANPVAKKQNTSVPCAPLTADELKRVLGGAFNHRYMSTVAPSVLLQDNRPGRRGEGGSRRANASEGFVVAPSHRRTLGDDAAWLHDAGHDAQQAVNVAVAGDGDGDGGRRRGRRAFNPTPWACKWRVLWTDLGSDYFPRFLRSVECEQRTCWYNTFACRGRAFAVKVLKRVRGACAETPPPPPPSPPPAHRSPPAELWLWEERAVTFCCECALIT